MRYDAVADKPEFEGGAGGRVVITGSLDITLADGTVEKRPFVANIPISDLKEDPNG